MARSQSQTWRTSLRTTLQDVSFIHVHYFYFCATCLMASLIFWGSSTPAKSVRYIDSLFLCISAMTEAGLNTINLSELNTWQQVMLFLLIIAGSAIFVSSAILHVRKRAFEQRFAELAEQRRRRRLMRPRTLSFSFSRRRPSTSGDHESAVASGAVRGRAIKEPVDHLDNKASIDRERTLSNLDTAASQAAVSDVGAAKDDQNSHIRFPDMLPAADHTHDPVRPRPSSRHRTSFFEGRGVGARPLDNHPRNVMPTNAPYLPDRDEAITDEENELRKDPRSKLGKYINTVNGYLGRNSQIHGLSEKERKKLGGIEYDAICLLSWVVPLYFFLFQLFGALGVGAWIRINRPGMTLTNGLDPFWTGAFFAVSAFNNSGMALLDANATVLQTSYYVLLTMSLLILAGNTCFPPFLRLILWTMKKAISRKNPTSSTWQRRRQTLEFCLDHPRRVYTNLFPAAQTWWLVFSLVMLNGIDWVAFELLNIGNPVTDAIPVHFRVLDGLFQAFAVRSGGFYVVSISGLRSGLLVLYVAMMYISAFPIAMTIRNTNVYEERSLGIYAEDIEEAEKEAERGGGGELSEKGLVAGHKFISGFKRTMTLSHGTAPASPKLTTWTRQDFVRQQLRGQLGHDLWILVLAVFMITAIETGQFERDPVNFSTFNIIFEVVSAYGCVGISVGIPWAAYSFCGTWHTASKLVLCVVMLRGRHRGLPVSIDRAILLPDESLAWAEEEDANRRGAHAAMPSLTIMPSREVLRHRRTNDSGGGPGPSVLDSVKDAGHLV
ncbi:hypothetical protein PV08_02929 [Exophiala spinifera]|uniref:Potassium transport protein n=1 Tax=Exophiala spinifera TaxID=91928 RepID=A0A0D2BJ81_9EURO|nr:uncharacterized protein PV08_02929 [Exophiala spinifera]KIW18640.1 hypothetical protein PV08_02929 [Exophiala spinifera]